MTREEQIKQKAHDYTYTNDHNWTWDDSGESRVDISAEVDDAYIAGAHSRDEEILKLQTNIDAMESYIEAEKACMQDEIDEMQEQLKMNAENIQKLRNPWISVEDRLPDNGDMVLTRSVLIIKGGGERSEDEQFLVQKFVGYWLTDCCKQHRMHGFIYDTLDKVTHWMPIPELPCDEMLINGLNEMNEHFKKGE